MGHRDTHHRTWVVVLRPGGEAPPPVPYDVSRILLHCCCSRSCCLCCTVSSVPCPAAAGQLWWVVQHAVEGRTGVGVARTSVVEGRRDGRRAVRDVWPGGASCSRAPRRWRSCCSRTRSRTVGLHRLVPAQGWPHW
uniref:Uncharacterized protein n=1 Tax=Cacopsylla melanoneura TaxID=428564 RepID=A0A8D8V440_9HEMI